MKTVHVLGKNLKADGNLLDNLQKYQFQLTIMSWISIFPIEIGLEEDKQLKKENNEALVWNCVFSRSFDLNLFFESDSTVQISFHKGS